MKSPIYSCHSAATAFRGLFFTCGIVFALLPNQSFGQARKTIEDKIVKRDHTGIETPVEIRFTDQSNLKLTIIEEKIDFRTDYGLLTVPMSDIKRIEFAMRIPDEVQRRIEAALTDLGDPQFRRREKAGMILLALREKAYPAVMKATASADMEVASRAEELIKRFRETVPAEMLQIRDNDVIHTDKSRISGRIEAGFLRAITNQFGEVQLRLPDIFTLVSRFGEATDADLSSAAAAPTNMMQYQNDIGKTFVFRVTGSTNGSVWGTDSYTTDSSIALAAVHCGLVQPGQSAIVRVTLTPGQGVYVGTTRNGVVSSSFGTYPVSYRMQK